MPLDSNGGPVKGWVNPYRNRIKQFDGRIFIFENPKFDRERIAKLIAEFRAEHGEDGTVAVEIGSGAGKHLIGLALRDPKVLALGFEIRFKRSVRTIEKAVTAGARNVYVMHTDGKLVERLLPPGAVDRLYVNFPDPWAKHRQRKHRIVNLQFLNDLRVVLAAGGEFILKTDHSEYFASAAALLKRSADFSIKEYSENLHCSEFNEENIETDFEEIFRGQGLPINYLKAALNLRATSYPLLPAVDSEEGSIPADHRSYTAHGFEKVSRVG